MPKVCELIEKGYETTDVMSVIKRLGIKDAVGNEVVEDSQYLKVDNFYKVEAELAKTCSFQHRKNDVSSVIHDSPRSSESSSDGQLTSYSNPVSREGLMRVYALSKQWNVDSVVILQAIKQLGIEGKGSSLSALTSEEVEKIASLLEIPYIPERALEMVSKHKPLPAPIQPVSRSKPDLPPPTGYIELPPKGLKKHGKDNTPNRDPPLRGLYLAIVGRNNVGQFGKRNAFPLLYINEGKQSISSEKVHEGEFPNFGYILLNASCQNIDVYPWNFVLVSPNENSHFAGTQDTAVTKYLAYEREIQLLARTPDISRQIAVILEVREEFSYDCPTISAFNQYGARHSATPYFFVRDMSEIIYGPLQLKSERGDVLQQTIEWDYPELTGVHEHTFFDEKDLEHRCSGNYLTIGLNDPPGFLSDPVVQTFNFITGNILLCNSSDGAKKDHNEDTIEQTKTLNPAPSEQEPGQQGGQSETALIDPLTEGTSENTLPEPEPPKPKVVRYWDARPENCGIPISKEFSEFLSAAEKESEKDFFKHLYSRLLACDGRYSQEFFANIYVCLKSFPLNLISGPPGCGKSTLVRTLSAAIGHPNALLNIYVKRKWSDDRDLLGGYDGFNNRYNPGPSGLAKRLAWAEVDWEPMSKKSDLKSSALLHQSFYTILMDEFNLAPPEYYFSTLLQNLDKECGNREITLFDKAEINQQFDENDKEPRDTHRDKIQIYDNIRFWGTINNDETTERLSPRLLDRTGMIFINPLEDTPPPTSATPSITDEDREKCVYAGRIVNWIKKPNPNEGIPKVFNEVMNDLRSKNLMPSKRVEKAINVYMANAQGILEEKQAADFVFQQRVIPLLQGRGRVEKFKDTMEDLKKTLENSNMHRSAGHIKRAIARAGDYDDIDLLGY